MTTAAEFSKVWNRKAEEIGCPARAKFAKRGMKAFEWQGEVSGEFEVWRPISVARFEQIVARFPTMEMVKA